MKPQSLRPKTNRKSGGQPGHEGNTLQKVEPPDSTVQHRPDACPRCGNHLQGTQGQIVQTRQVIDLPEVIRLVTVEHQAIEVCCPGCSHRVKGTFPEGVVAPVQYGPHLQATCVLLKEDQALSLNRIVSFLTDWLGQSPSEGTIQNWIGLASRRLQDVEQRVKAGIAGSKVAGFDETMVRCGGKSAWIHVARTVGMMHFCAPGGRGKAAMESAGILPGFSGVAVHDAWSGYFGFENCGHALCGAHLLREGKAIGERFADAKGWSDAIIHWLLDVKARVESKPIERDESKPVERDELVGQLRGLVTQGYESLGLSPPREGEKLSACATALRSRWLDRLWFYAAEVTRFGWNVPYGAVPFDNNGSERDIRPIKRFAKVFGCWRSSAGLADFCRIRGYLSTLSKAGISARAGIDVIPI
jgi:transposase